MDSLEDLSALTLDRVDFKSVCAHKGVVDEEGKDQRVLEKELHASSNRD